MKKVERIFVYISRFFENEKKAKLSNIHYVE